MAFLPPDVITPTCCSLLGSGRTVLRVTLSSRGHLSNQLAPQLPRRGPWEGENMVAMSQGVCDQCGRRTHKLGIQAWFCHFLVG